MFISLMLAVASNASANEKKNILDLQVSKAVFEQQGRDPEGKNLRVALINLNPTINVWFVVKAEDTGGGPARYFHLENPSPQDTTLVLGMGENLSLQLSKGDRATVCSISLGQWTELLQSAIRQNDSYAPICDQQLYLRAMITGRQSSKEAVASFLRKHVWGGETITTMVKSTIYKDSFMLEGEADSHKAATDSLESSTGPLAASVETQFQGKLVSAAQLGIPVPNAEPGFILAGKWYPTTTDPNIYLSAIEAGIVNKEILQSYPDRVAPLDAVEQKAVSYLVAFDLEMFSTGFAIGTDSPSVEWSNRVMQEFTKNSPGSGPDGIGSIAPLVATGRIRPDLVNSIAGTFTGGFKRNHGAFRHGDLATVNKGSHYGFIESGTVFSTLQPGLATALINAAGEFSMKTWEQADDANLLPKILHARQNGVPLIEGLDPKTQEPQPGKLVRRWGPGNWSGSIDSKERALRAGICTTSRGNKKFLIYGYFSTATPNAMARIFQAYHCDYAFHLDMNALEHTYLATYSVHNQRMRIHNLIQGMRVLDREHQDNVSPRFLGISDNRDFFYLRRKPAIIVETKAQERALDENQAKMLTPVPTESVVEPNFEKIPPGENLIP